MTPQDLIADLRSRINPAYAAQRGTESYERRLCAEALESQQDEIERLRTENAELRAERDARVRADERARIVKRLREQKYMVLTPCRMYTAQELCDAERSVVNQMADAIEKEAGNVHAL